MAFQFPPSPSVDQTYTPVAGVTYRWSGTAWHLIAGPGAFITQADADTRYVSLTNPVFTVPVRHADGTLAAPGISWVNDPDSGWARGAGGEVVYSMNGVARLTMLAAGAATINSQFVVTSGSWDGNVASWSSTNVRVQPGAGSLPSIGLQDDSVARVWTLGSERYFQLGRNDALGPGTIANYSMKIAPNGDVWARSFNVVTTAMTNEVPIAGALEAVLKLRGVRCSNSETGRPDIRVELDDVELAFPELVGELRDGSGENVTGKSVNYAMLAAPIIEAIRELNDRLTALENRLTALENSP